MEVLWVPRPEERSEEFYKPSNDDSGWKEIPAPSNIEVQGCGTPIHIKFSYPFKKDGPHVKGEPPREYSTYLERDPVGSYHREFEVPALQKGTMSIRNRYAFTNLNNFVPHLPLADEHLNGPAHLVDLLPSTSTLGTLDTRTLGVGSYSRGRKLLSQ